VRVALAEGHTHLWGDGVGCDVAEATGKRRSPPWHRDELILALDLYVRGGSLGGGHIPEKDAADVVELSRRISLLPIWNAGERASTFRNPSGVVLKLANFRAVERAVSIDRGIPDARDLPKGMQAFGALDRIVFEEFLGRWSDLRLEAASITAASDVASADIVKDARGRYLLARDAPVDGGGVADYEAAAGPGGERSRSEARLVEEYATHLSARGHTVTGRHYLVEGEARVLRADLFIRDVDVLVEAKATDARHAVRMAIGQLSDYRRFEPTEPGLAVLLPRRPIPDLERLLVGLDIGLVWPVRGGFRDTVAGRLVD
jgi:hypothetical protein